MTVLVWKLISETFEAIHKPIIPAAQLLKEIKDDKRIWNLFKLGLTCTLNQVDSDNGMQQAKKFGISSFEEGALIAAAIRPSFDAWRERFLNRAEYSTGSKDLDEVLKLSNHYILFQENLMQYFEWLDVTPAESIGLIKKISKKKIKEDDFKKLEERIKKTWIKKTGSEKMFKETWDMIQSCMAYGFASPHACSTSLDMCYGAYLKVNYPLEYYTVCLNNYSNDETRTNKLINELSYFNITLRNIKFRYSNSDYSFDKKTNTIYKGLASIKFINAIVPNEMYELRNNKYVSFVDLLADLYNKTSINSRQLDILIKLDFFSEFGDVNYLLKVVEIYNKLASKKQFNKEALESYGVPLDTLRKYVGKETAKLYKEVDTQGVITELVSSLSVPKLSILGHIKYEQELLGYPTSTDDTQSKRVFLIMSITSNRAVTKLKLYCIHDGKTHECNIWNTEWEKQPGAENDLIFLYGTRKQNKREPTGEINPKTGKKKYRDVPDQFEYWLTGYEIITEEELTHEVD